MGWRFAFGWLGKCVLGASLILFSLSHASAGAWLRDEGQTQLIFSGMWSGASQRFDTKGKPRASGPFAKASLVTLGEYGLGKEITLLAGFGALHQQWPAAGLRQSSVEANLLAGARLRLWSNKDTILSAQVTSEASGERQFAVLSRRFVPPVSADTRLLLGHAFTLAGMNGFADLQMGWRWRGGAHPDEAHIDITLGLRPFSKTLILLQSFNSISPHRDRRLGLGPARRHKVQTSVVYDLTDKLALQAGAFTGVAGKESIKERGGLLAIQWKI